MGKKIGRPPRLALQICKSISKDYVQKKAPGDRLPTEQHLAKHFQVNRRTIRAALTILTENKEIIRKPSGGAYVAESRRVTWHNYNGKFIGLIFPTPTWGNDHFRSEIYTGLITALHGTGINVAMAATSWRWNEEDFDIHNPASGFQSKDILGTLVVGKPWKGILNSLKELERPIVAVDFDATQSQTDSFAFDNYGAGWNLGKRLHSMGHRRIATVIEAPSKPIYQTDEAWAERKNGFFDFQLKHQLDAPICIHTHDRGLSGGTLKQINQVFGQPAEKRPTALLLPGQCTDELFNIFAKHRIKIHRDLTIVGFDLTTSTLQNFTAIRFSAQKLGCEAVLHLLSRIRDPKWRARKTTKITIKGQYHSGKTHGRIRTQA